MKSHHTVATTTELLAGLHESDGPAWEEFDLRYRPILVGFLRKMGLNDADAVRRRRQRFFRRLRRRKRRVPAA